jgi:hypothetical protein
LQDYQDNGLLHAYFNIQFNQRFSPEGIGTQAAELLGYKYYEKYNK